MSDQSDKEFKVQRDFKSMKSFLVATCVGNESPSLEKAKKSILELFDSWEDESNEPPAKKPCKKPTRPLEINTSDEDIERVSMKKHVEQFVPAYEEGAKGTGKIAQLKQAIASISEEISLGESR